MNKRRMECLTNLLRHSTDVEFKIPLIYFTDKYSASPGIEKNRKEIQDALMTLEKDTDLTIDKISEDETVTLIISIIQPNGD